MNVPCARLARRWCWQFCVLSAVLLVSQFPNAMATTFTHVNLHPEIQMYSYPAASSNGAGSVRDRAPTFGAYSGLDEKNSPVFFAGTGFDPSRRGSFLAITNTSEDVPAGLDPARYLVTSLRVETTLLGSLIYQPLNYVLPYDNTVDDSLVLTTVGDDDAGRPMEMYGLGFQGDYSTASFESAASDPKLFQLGDVRWKTYGAGDPEFDPAEPNAISPYQYFAVDADGRDAENAVYGGYSATEHGGVTAQFTPSPFAIGNLYDAPDTEASPGTLLENGDVFVFEPNLDDVGIVDYLQLNLAQGYLGFSFSSLHEPAGHEGTVPYPDFYLDDLDVGTNPNGAAPRFELSVTVLDPFAPGDFDRDRDIDDDDYHTWRNQVGNSVVIPGSDADGNADGIIDAADYVVWRKNLPGFSGTGSAHAAIPEPSAVLLAMMAGAFLGTVRRRFRQGS